MFPRHHFEAKGENRAYSTEINWVQIGYKIPRSPCHLAPNKTTAFKVCHPRVTRLFRISLSGASGYRGLRIAPVKLAPITSVKLAPVRLAPVRLASVRLAPCRLAPCRLAPCRLAPCRLALKSFRRFRRRSVRLQQPGFHAHSARSSASAAGCPRLVLPLELPRLPT